MARFDGIATIGFQGDRASARKAIGLVQDEANRTKIRLNIEAGKGFAPLGKISSDLNQFQASLDASVARTLAFGASVGVIGGVTRAFRDMLAAGIAVEKSIADINAVFKLGSAQLQTFSSGLFDIAKNTKQSFDKVTQAATEFSRQGLSVEETLKRTDSAMTLVRLAGIDTATAVNSLTAAMNGFSSAGLDSVEIVNKLTTVDAAFAVSTSDLVQGLSRAGDVAQSAGVSFDELLAAVTAVQQRTARGGAIIGNSLKTILTRLQSPENTKALESIGVSVYDSNGAFREGIQILKDYAAARSNLADSERAGLDKKLAGGYQINSFLALLAELKDEYGAFNEAVRVSRDATDEAKKRMELLNNTVAALGAKLSATGTQLSSFIFNSAFEDGAKMAMGQIQAVGDLLTTALNPETIKGGGLKGVFAGLTQGAFEGVGKFIFGGGGIEALRVMSKLVVFLSAEAYKAAANVANIGSQKQKEEQYARRVSELLARDVEYMRMMGDSSLTNLEFQKETTKALERQALIMERSLQIQKQIRAFVPANPAIVSRVIKDTGGKSGLFGAAGGYSPIDLGKAKEQGMIRDGVGGARPTDKPRVIRGFNFGGGKKGTIVANTGEHYVPDFGGVGDAIFNRDMVAKYGLPRGAMPVAGGFIPNFARTQRENPFAPITTPFVNAILKKGMRAVRDRGLDYSSPEGKREVLFGVESHLKGLGLSPAAKEEAIRQLGRITRDYDTYKPSDAIVEGGDKNAKYASVAAREAEVAKRLAANQQQRAARQINYDLTDKLGIIHARPAPLQNFTYRTRGSDPKKNLTYNVKLQTAGLNLNDPSVDSQIDLLEEKVAQDVQGAVNSYVSLITGKDMSGRGPINGFANKGTVNAVLGNAFETSLYEALGMDFARKGGQNAAIDFPNPPPKMRSLFHNMPAAGYEAKFRLGRDAYKSFFNKAAAVGLIKKNISAAELTAMDSAYAAKQGATAAAGFIPNFARFRNINRFTKSKEGMYEYELGGDYIPERGGVLERVIGDPYVSRLKDTFSRHGIPDIDVGLTDKTLFNYAKDGRILTSRGKYQDRNRAAIVSTKNRSQNTDQNYESILRTLGHELGHGFDYEIAKKFGMDSRLFSDMPIFKREVFSALEKFRKSGDAAKIPSALKTIFSRIESGSYPLDKYPREVFADMFALLHGKRASGKVRRTKIGSVMNRFIGVPKMAGGYIPNFSAVQDAMGREAAAIGDSNGVRVGTHPSLKSPFNKEGIGVYNNREGSLGAGIQMARMAGVEDVKSKGMVPNFAAPSKLPTGQRKVLDAISNAGGQIQVGILAKQLGITIKELNARFKELGIETTKTIKNKKGESRVVGIKGGFATVSIDEVSAEAKDAGAKRDIKARAIRYDRKKARDAKKAEELEAQRAEQEARKRAAIDNFGRLPAVAAQSYTMSSSEKARREAAMTARGIKTADEISKELADKNKPAPSIPKQINDYFDKSGWRKGNLGEAGSSKFSDGKFFDKATRGMNAFVAQMAVSAAAGGLAAAGFKNGAKAAESVASGFQAATTAAALIPGPFGAMAGVATGVVTTLVGLASKFGDKTEDLAKSLDTQILKNAEVAQSLSGAIASYDKFTIAMEKNDPTRAFRAYSEMAEQIGKAATNNPAISGKFFSAIAEKDPEKRSEAFQTLQQEVAKTEQRAKDARDSIELARKLGEDTLTGVEGRGILQKRQDENFSYADLSTSLKEITASLKADSSRANADAQYEKLKTLVDNPAQLEAIRTAIYDSGIDGWRDVTSSLVEFLNDAAANLGEGADTKSFLEEMSKKMKPILDAEIEARKKAMEASNKFDIAMLKASVSTQFFASQLKGQLAFEAKKRSIDFESASDILSSLDLITPEQSVAKSGARSRAEIEIQTKEEKRQLGIEVASKLDSLASEIGTGQNPKDVEALSKLADLSSRLKGGADVKEIGAQLNEESFRKLLDKDGKDSKTETYLKKLIEIGADAINNDTALSQAETQEKKLQEAKTLAELRKLVVDRYQQATMDSGGFVQTQKDIGVLSGTAITVEGIDAKVEAYKRSGQNIGYEGSEDIDLLIKKRMLAQAEALQEGAGAYIGNRAVIAGGEEEILARANRKLEELNSKGTLSGNEQAAKGYYERIISETSVAKEAKENFNGKPPEGPSAEVSAIYAGLQSASDTLKGEFDILKQATVDLGKTMEDVTRQRENTAKAVAVKSEYDAAQKKYEEAKKRLFEEEDKNNDLGGSYAGSVFQSDVGRTVDRTLEKKLADEVAYLAGTVAKLGNAMSAAEAALNSKPANARGYISRNFASGKSNRISEMLAASAAGYKTPLSASEVRTGIVDGNVVTYNSRESIVRSGGATAIIPPRDSKAFNSFGKNAAAGSDSYGSKELASILREIQRGQEKVIAAVQSNRTVSLDGDVGINANISAAISSANLSSEVAQIIKSEIEKSLPALIKKAVQDSVALSVKTITKLF